MKLNNRKYLLFVLTLVLIFTGCSIDEEKINKKFSEITQEENDSKSDGKDLEDIEESEEETQKEEIYTARLKFLGDVFPHNAQLKYAKNVSNNGGYDFSQNFEELKEYTKDADLTMLNNEFTYNENREYSTYPLFNIPHEIYDTFKDIGIDVVSTANNHSLDTGVEGIDTTIDQIEKRDILHTGTFKGDEKKYIITEVNNIKVGILSYAEQLNGLDNLLDTEEKKNKVNKIDRDNIKRDINDCINDGAEFVIVYPHWGNEYESYPTQDQISLGRDMVEWGADLIIGLHPHVVQPKEIYTTNDNRKGYIYYSLGNLFSNQRYETMNDYRTEQGLSVEIAIRKSSLDKKAEVVMVKDHPIWISATDNEYGKFVRPYVTTEYVESQEDIYSLLNENAVYRLKKAYDDVFSVLDNTIKE